jgi:hypothetical protein
VARARAAQGPHLLRTRLEQRIECALLGTRPDDLRVASAEVLRLHRGAQIQDPIADGHARSRPTVTRAEDTEREILHGEVGRRFVRGFDPRAQRGVVRRVDRARHSRPSSRRPATGSSNEQEPNASPSDARARAICVVDAV